MALPVSAAHVVPAEPWVRPGFQGLYKGLLKVADSAAALTARRHVTGLENIPKKGPFLLVMNHVGYGDFIGIMKVLRAARPDVRFIAAREEVSGPGLKQVMILAGPILVDRNTPQAKQVLQQMPQVYEAGQGVGIFPDGEFAAMPDKLKKGAALSALTNGVPVIPMVHWGAEEALDRAKHLKVFSRRPHVMLRVMKPVEMPALPEGFDPATAKIPFALVEEGTARIRQALRDGVVSVQRAKALFEDAFAQGKGPSITGY